MLASYYVACVKSPHKWRALPINKQECGMYTNIINQPHNNDRYSMLRTLRDAAVTPKKGTSVAIMRLT